MGINELFPANSGSEAHSRAWMLDDENGLGYLKLFHQHHFTDDAALSAIEYINTLEYMEQAQYAAELLNAVGFIDITEENVRNVLFEEAA